MFGFAIMGSKLRELNGSDYYSPARQGKLKLVELNDCGDLWIIKFEFFDGTKQLKAIKKEPFRPNSLNVEFDGPTKFASLTATNRQGQTYLVKQLFVSYKNSQKNRHNNT